MPKTITVITDEDRLRLHRALGMIPFSTGLVPRLDDISIDTVLDMLTALSHRLAVANGQHIRDREELDDFRAMIKWSGRMVGMMLTRGVSDD